MQDSQDIKEKGSCKKKVQIPIHRGFRAVPSIPMKSELAEYEEKPTFFLQNSVSVTLFLNMSQIGFTQPTVGTCLPPACSRNGVPPVPIHRACPDPIGGFIGKSPRPTTNQGFDCSTA